MRVIVPLAEGFEEIEAVTIIDVLRRAGVEVTSAFLKKNPVTGSHAISVTADKNIEGIKSSDFDCMVLPGGMPGSANLKDDQRVIELAREFSSKEKIVAAICAAPLVLGYAGVLKGRRATCYPGFEAQMTGATPVADPVVRDGTVITGRGPGCAIPFALELVAALAGKQVAEQLRESMQVYWM
ncbi:MAG: DJ-1/PfpI family protein [Spirochaetes bacterium]|nr:DJ-1/PfpI family protein [Spirochaetota bacterium]